MSAVMFCGLRRDSGSNGVGESQPVRLVRSIINRPSLFIIPAPPFSFVLVPSHIPQLPANVAGKF